MTRENAIAAAILGELVPELGYAAPVLLERYDRGDPLVETAGSTDLGFETGAVDSVLLEFFKALVPYVKTALACGMLGAFQTWQSSKRESRNHVELIARLNAVLDENAKGRQAVERIAEFVTSKDKAPTSTNEVVESFAVAADRLSATDAAEDDDATDPHA